MDFFLSIINELPLQNDVYHRVIFKLLKVKITTIVKEKINSLEYVMKYYLYINAHVFKEF